MRKGTSYTVSIQMLYLMLVSDFEDDSHLSEQCLLHHRTSIDICLVDDKELSNSYPGCWHCPLLRRRKNWYLYTNTHIHIHTSFASMKTLLKQGSNSTLKFTLNKVRKPLYSQLLWKITPVSGRTEGETQPLVTGYWGIEILFIWMQNTYEKIFMVIAFWYFNILYQLG